MPHTAGMAAPSSHDHVDLRCAAWTVAQAVDPIGSAVQVDRFVTFEVPQPWPARTEDLGWSQGLPGVPGVRLQAIVPEAAREDGTVLVNRWERAGAVLEGTDWLVPAATVPAALARVVAGDAPDDAESTPSPPEVLVCGHGTRDRCCGGSGTRLAIEVRAELPELRVRRTSHLGGHRFAPTALTFPDGRMWAHLDASTLVGIVHRSVAFERARRHYRGNTALDPWAQAVEGTALAERGWELASVDDLAATVEGTGDRRSVTVGWSGPSGRGERRATVEIARRYPVLQCGLPPEEATKEAEEYVVTS